MDFAIDIAMAVLMRTLKDKKKLRELRPLFLKLAAAIETVFEVEPSFGKDLEVKKHEMRSK